MRFFPPEGFPGWWYVFVCLAATQSTDYSIALLLIGFLCIVWEVGSKFTSIVGDMRKQYTRGTKHPRMLPAGPLVKRPKFPPFYSL